MYTKPFKQNCDEVAKQLPRALYVHVPFCRAKCRYCDFYSLPDAAMQNDAKTRYVQAVLAEILNSQSLLSLPLASVFWGGGTPTALGAELLERLAAAMRPMVSSETEFSAEANPGVFDEKIARIFSENGVNRVNFGVQSFDPAELKLLGRIHSPRQAEQAFTVARAAGLRNLGLDLIYGLPGQSLESWRRSLEKAMELEPEHLSCYALSFEEGTPLAEDLRQGRVAAMEDSLQKECYELAIEAARARGLEQYEISNFARAGRQCRHNLTYWRNETYLGVGPAAASYVGGIRKTNFADLARYLDCVVAGRSCAQFEENLTLRQRMGETLMLGLRLVDGVDCAAFARRFGQTPQEAFPQAIGRYLSQNAIVMDGNELRLARWAFFASDTILADIVAESGLSDKKIVQD